MKKIISIIFLLVIMMIILTGCSTESNNANQNNVTKSMSKSNTTSKTSNSTNTSTTLDSIDFKANAEKQMAEPKEGEEIAIMHIKDYGDVYFKFFPEIAPKAVENFKTHSKNGYYNGLTFHRVINEFMIQGGDPDGNGTGGESIWGNGFGTELDYSLVPYRGSLCMAMSSLPNSIGSQFFITQANYSEQMANTLKLYNYPEGLVEQYKNNGGYLSLYMQYTVFGQAFKGMDIVDKIAVVDTDTTKAKSEGKNTETCVDKPLTDVIIESVEITNYSK